ncbi:hypothetical protein PSH28_07360 [Pseudomonas resinovorans]|uniref:hypothetical protein n=1 Tax=Metapseudomonas resinovorans TaxID=53412 RepID=UPI00237F501B|nr:hypothetical protein [Pseudomonas resinovorans]MDE3736404.1 hypothetical protein [Pseudomonas resinovorans]
MDNIVDRFRAVIRQNTSDKRRWAELEALTEIPATSWNKAFNGKQRPTIEMVQAVARLWPEYAFWLATGVTDAKHGHISCRNGALRQFYPERSFSPRNAAKPYFAQLIDSFNRTYGDSNPYESDIEENEARVQLARLEVAREAEEQALNEIDGTSAIEALKKARGALKSATERANEETLENLRQLTNSQDQRE